MFGVDDAILGAGALQAGAALYGANKQSSAADNASRQALEQFYVTQGNLQPWMQQGTVALGSLGNFLGLPGSQSQPGVPGQAFGAGTQGFGLDQFQASPAYQFNLEQGKNAIDKAAAARSGYYQPATLQDIARFSQGLASNEFQNAFSNYNTTQGNIFSRLNAVSGAGQNAAANLGSIGANVAGTVGNNMIGAGNAQAAGAVGAGNAIGGTAASLYNNYLMQQILARNQSPVIPGAGDTGWGIG